MSDINLQSDNKSVEDLIEAACDRFDQMWANSERPNIGDFLTSVDSFYRPRLLNMLIEIDIEYRTKNQIESNPENYFMFGVAAVEAAKKAIQETERKDASPIGVLLPEIPNYRIEKKIGEGGMGSVFLAEQEGPIRRHVAIKVIKTDYGSTEIVRRFESERQALAIMDHPGIAKIFDVGTTVNGVPYFSMEWVQGDPITRFCNQQQLSILKRIKIFLKVCRAICHAHQKGIMHRDLKPSNILVMDTSSGPEPKVIDFGLAKATQRHVRLTEETIHTQLGVVVGSPEYMSPEQTDPEQKLVDTRSDVYSLGIILYELLTGMTPIGGNKYSIYQTFASIRECEIVRPSSKLNELPNEVEKIALQRKTTSFKLRQQIRGELDWIVMKAVNWNPDNRYQSVEAFQDDIHRYLNNEPVKARAPSSLYVLGKTIQKQKTVLATLGAFIILLLAAITVITNLYLNEKYVRISSEENQARAKFFSAIGFWERNQSKEAIRILNEIRKRYRFIEWNLAKKQFEENCVTFNDEECSRVYSVVISPDGKSFASTGYGGVISIWDLKRHTIKRRIDVGSKYVRSISFHPNGKMLAAGESTGKLSVWNVQTGKLLFHTIEPNGPIRSVVFSHDGKKLAFAGGPNPDSDKKKGELRISILDVDDPSKILRLVGHSARINDMVFSHDDMQIVSGSHDKTVRFWDVTTGEEINRFELKSFALSVAFGPSDQCFACGTANNKLILWEIDQEVPSIKWKRNAYKLEGDTVECISFNPNGNELVTGGFEGTSKIWEIEFGNSVKTLRGHQLAVGSAVYLPDGKHLLSGSEDGTVKLWDLTLESETRVLTSHTQSINAISFSPDSRLIASGSGANEFDVASKKLMEKIDNSIRVRDLESGVSKQLIGHTNSVTDVEFNPTLSSGGQLVSSSVDGTIRFWNRSANWSAKSIVAHEGKPVHCFDFHPNGKQIVSAGGDGSLRIWNVESKEEIKELKGHRSAVYSVAWSKDGKWIASAEKSKAGEFILWNAQTGEIKWRKYEPYITSLAFSLDSSALVSGQNDLKIWNVQTGALSKMINHSRLRLYFASFNNDIENPRLLIGGRQGQTWLWDAEKWEELIQLDIDSEMKWNFVYDGKFSPNGQMIATANGDGTIRIWDVFQSGNAKK